MIRPNTFPNEAATEDARQKARDALAPVPRSFVTNEVVVRANEPVEPEDLEALSKLGLLAPESRFATDFVQAFLAALLVTVIVGLYISRFERSLYENSRFMLLLAVIFLMVLAGARLVGPSAAIYLYPTAMLALLYVSLANVRVALVGTLGMAFLLGLMLNGSLELATMVAAGGFIGILTLRSTERLNNYFVAGIIIGLANAVVVTVFNLGSIGTTPVAGVGLNQLVPFSLINGVFAGAATIAGLYLVTLAINLPTGLKLAELSQPNQPLLQRLLREAPGTYQHSLQVANLSEQAAQTVGANAELVRVAALYHDIGKMLNPIFFSENQHFGSGNPHDALDDPYRSADIIIRHVTDGVELAKQYRLPFRLRDFILEHHGTTEVYVFYRRAVEAAGGDESAVDIGEFRYPGPRPQTRETAILMLADSCESAVRSIGPTSKHHVSEIVNDIFEGKMHGGQLDESQLTLNDIKAIQRIFVEMLQAVYHPRIDYKKATTQQRSVPAPAAARPRTQTMSAVKEATSEVPKVITQNDSEAASLVDMPAPNMEDDDLELLSDDDTPMSDVPALPRSGEFNKVNGKSKTPSADEKEKEE